MSRETPAEMATSFAILHSFYEIEVYFHPVLNREPVCGVKLLALILDYDEICCNVILSCFKSLSSTLRVSHEHLIPNTYKPSFYTSFSYYFYYFYSHSLVNYN